MLISLHQYEWRGEWLTAIVQYSVYIYKWTTFLKSVRNFTKPIASRKYSILRLVFRLNWAGSFVNLS